MKPRMMLTTFVAGAALVLLGGCNNASDAPAENKPTTSLTTPAESSLSKAEAKLVGDWEDPAAEWVMHFHDDGSYVMDYQGLTDFNTGTFTVDRSEISLISDDGNTDKGQVEGDKLVFKLGTLTRK